MRFFVFFILSLIFLFAGCATTTSSRQEMEIKKTNCVKNFDSEVCSPVNIYITVTGKGTAPADENLNEVQRYLLSERAAIVDAYRKLAEKLQGFIVKTLTSSGNYIVNKDAVRVQAEAYIKGAEIVDIHHFENGICEAKVKILQPNPKGILRRFVSYLY